MSSLVATLTVFLTYQGSIFAPAEAFSNIKLSSKRTTSFTKLNNVFKDLLDNAFANDSTLAPNSIKGGIDAALDDETNQNGKPTNIQERWKKSQQQLTLSKTGAPVNAELLTNTKWNVQLYLAGIPDKDPSSNLFGRKVNISTRDKTLGIGAEIDEKPNAVIEVTLEKDGIATTDSTDFTSGNAGEWKLSDDSTFIRFSLDTVGFVRTLRTTGTINKVYWSKEDDVVSKTSATYSIPPGLIFADARIGYGRPGEFIMKEGVLRCEKSSGLLGAATKLLVCGKFKAEMIVDSS